MRCMDRFSLLPDEAEGEDGLVRFWDPFDTILKEPVHSAAKAVEVLDTIANYLRDSSGPAGDFGTLKSAIDDFGPSFFSTIWPAIIESALQMPKLFPSGHLNTLHPSAQPHLQLSRSQVRCLVAHQFLCTFSAPAWREDYYDFSIWYDSSQRHPTAARMYLKALFTYFGDLNNIGDLEDYVEYSLHTTLIPGTTATQDGQALHSASVLIQPQYSTEPQELSYEGLQGAVVVSANKDIGFGQSATQEELYVGNCPEACPAVLITPTLEGNQTLTIKGAKPILRITGQRRDIECTVLEPELRRGGRMLFMDALEIDEIDKQDGTLPDLEPENIKRELEKAYSAFSSWPASDGATVWAGLWGCGSFNGDPGVKMCILWMAASLAGKELRIICDESGNEFASCFRQLIGQFDKGATVGDLRRRLYGTPRETKRLEVLRDLLERVGI